MPTTTTTTARRLNRRSLLSRALVGAAGAAIGTTAIMPVAKAALAPMGSSRQDDAVLLDAERRLAERRSSELGGDIWELVDTILLTPPLSLAGALVKLRLLCDEEIGIFAAGASDEEEAALLQVIAFLEAQAAGGAA